MPAIPKLRILFLCTGNSCRSQMAEGWARKLKSEEVEPFSAGLVKHGLNQKAVQVMAEAGVDISGQYSKTIDQLEARDFDLIITLCDHAAETCPFFPGQARRLHHSFPDPPKLAAGAKSEAEELAPYRRVRDEIRQFIEEISGITEPAAREDGGKGKP